MTDGGEQRPTSNTAASAAPPRSNWTVTRVIGMVFASIGGLIGLALLVGGILLLATYAFGRDDDGYFNSDRQQLESATYAITTEDIDLGADEVDWAPDKILVRRLRRAGAYVGGRVRSLDLGRDECRRSPRHRRRRGCRRQAGTGRSGPALGCS